MSSVRSIKWEGPVALGELPGWESITSRILDDAGADQTQLEVGERILDGPKAFWAQVGNHCYNSVAVVLVDAECRSRALDDA